MKIKYIEKPFYHTIIYDFFDDAELNDIKNEINLIKNEHVQLDQHHESILANGNVKSYSLDILYENRRHESKILDLTTKVYKLYFDGKIDRSKNRFLNYIGLSNADNTMLHAYGNDSSYYEHHDKSVLSLVYPFFDTDFDGGELVFGNYKPKLESNCCLIFPSYEQHKVTQIKTTESGIVRWTINQRIFIRNG
jgi:hypothetical protein